VLTFEDCLGLCALDEDEIRAIAEHEHIPEIVAHMFIDAIRAAERRGDLAHAAHLKRCLRQFIEQHFAAHQPGSEP
jgi:hypothetical protein